VFIPLDVGTGGPVDVSKGVHNAGNDPAGSTIPFDPPATLPVPSADPSSDHSDADIREVLDVTTSFSMSANELQRMPRPWLLPAASVDAGTEATASALGCWEPHGRPGTNSLISRTDAADLPALQPTQQSSMKVL